MWNSFNYVGLLSKGPDLIYFINFNVITRYSNVILMSVFYKYRPSICLHLRAHTVPEGRGIKGIYNLLTAHYVRLVTKAKIGNDVCLPCVERIHDFADNKSQLHGSVRKI